MADGLADVLAGGSPILPAEMQALNAENQLAIANDPSKWQNMGIFGGLAHMMAQGQAQSQLQAALPQIVAARSAALPDLARAYSSPDPYQWAAQNPDADPLARWTLLNQSPGQAASTENVLADTLLRRTQAGSLAWQMANRQTLPSVFSPAAGGAPAPLSGALPPAPLPPGSLGGGYYNPVAGGAPSDVLTMPAAQLPAYLQRLNPTQRAMAMSRLRMNAYLVPASPAASAPSLPPGSAATLGAPGVR